ncbi:hypothetical protein RLOatenuis_0260 [Rickettsiales bacterium]|nr:hypothetical protein RLOatenuis_0260 [Rickettsiales bacterium]
MAKIREEQTRSRKQRIDRIAELKEMSKQRSLTDAEVADFMYYCTRAVAYPDMQHLNDDDRVALAN